MARETGGAVFEVKNGQTLETIYAEIEDLWKLNTISGIRRDGLRPTGNITRSNW